jgi:predicted 2-oxoglutarate/Fe(II)-dependent dioxygenase YbiX
MNYIIDRIEDHEHYHDLFIEILSHTNEKSFKKSWEHCNSKTLNHLKRNKLIETLCNNIINSSNLKNLVCSFYNKTEVLFSGSGWLNRYNEGEFQEPHTHVSGKDIVNPDLSFVYFLEIPEDSHCFNFCDRDGNNKKYINEKSGDLLLFEPKLHHSVDPNTSGDYRYTIAGNLYLK